MAAKSNETGGTPIESGSDDSEVIIGLAMGTGRLGAIGDGSGMFALFGCRLCLPMASATVLLIFLTLARVDHRRHSLKETSRRRRASAG